MPGISHMQGSQMSEKSYFSKGLFRFLSDLKKNNDREWFKSNKHRYENDVKLPCLEFIGDFASYLGKISSHFLADPRPVGGSLFRIYRDIRFTRDKSPYKTHTGIHFRHEMGKSVHAPGYYIHIESDNVFAGTGIWRPDSATLAKIRDAIVKKADEWDDIVNTRGFRADFDGMGDALKRPPRGFDPEHRHIEHLKKKDFITSRQIEPADVLRPDFPSTVYKIFKAKNRFMQFLVEAVGLQW